ncbi:MAG: PDZ domain-containing protein, partial [candidate division WOR-3 bacterium]
GSQAERLGFQAGDLVVSYNDVVVKSNDDLRQLIGETSASGSAVPLVLLRGDEEVTLSVQPGELGFVPEVGRYSSSLAVALEDILNYMGATVDYDWLAALTGETFTFTARTGTCVSSWPGGMSGVYLREAATMAGLSLGRIYQRAGSDSGRDAVALIRTALSRGRIVLVQGGWPDEKADYWGVAVRYDPDDSLIYGFSLGSAEELPLTGNIIQAYEVRRVGNAEEDPENVLSEVLVRALELGQAFADTGWQSGIAAYDLLIAALDTVPFCPVCTTGSQADFDRLLWTLRANRESANRFFADMREALPELAALLDEAIADNVAIIAKLDGIIRSGVRPGSVKDQEKLAVAFQEIELIETDLLGVYEDLLAEL